jgi:diazepam-binding inhibitor (GABA receptor modulating acyl-CoA-binding protein)
MDAELQLQDDFQAASKYVAGLSTSLDQETLLYFYARFKLVNFGPCNIDKPGFFDFQGKAKWTAWKSLYNMSKVGFGN